MNFGFNKEVRSRYNRSFQPWTTIEQTMESVCMPPVTTRLGAYYHTPKPHPWRPVMGYEIAEVTPISGQLVTNSLVDSCYTPTAMATEPIKMPNLVTGFERNPAHAARTALYTRFTPLEWTHNALQQYNNSDTNKNYSERLRCDALRLMREAEEKTAQNQRESGRRLGERLTDITYWRNEVNTELERQITETALLQDSRRALEKAIQDTEGPLHIAQECLYQREKRYGIDLVHDAVEQSLLQEIENLRNCQEKLRALLERTKNQLRNQRAAQHELETDLKSKEGALGIDNVCHELNNFSRGTNYYGGIERFDNTVTTPDMWAENSNAIIRHSQGERGRSSQLRSDIDNMINMCATYVWDHWSNTNNALSRRAGEVLETKSKLQMHLHKTQQEIFDIEKNIELLRKAILDKSNPLKVAHTRLEARSHRRDVENCNDYVQHSLVKEVNILNNTVETLNRKLQEAETQHQQLLKTRSNLETDLQCKVNSLFIDREKCMGLRRSFPITAVIKY